MTNALTDLVVELDGKVVGYLTESLAAYHKSLLARISVISAFRDDTNADNLRPMFSQVIILPVPGFQIVFHPWNICSERDHCTAASFLCPESGRRNVNFETLSLIELVRTLLGGNASETGHNPQCNAAEMIQCNAFVCC